jgi:hypothetical protein
MKQATTSSKLLMQPLPKPQPWQNGNQLRLLGAPAGGDYISPVERLKLFDSKKFENFVLQWADEYLNDKYDSVESRGGAGDKGRDVVAWIDPFGTPNRRYDNYQCKHYDSLLTPTQFWDELAKLCYYTSVGEIDIPANYIIMTSKGVGSKLLDFISKPVEIRRELISYWSQGKISVKAGDSIPKTLTTPLKEYVEEFDFSIISSVSPEDFIKQHEKTKYHALVFGVTVNNRRNITPPEIIDSTKEDKYIKLTLEAYGDASDNKSYSLSDLDSNQVFKKHLGQTRVCFYSAEALKEFSRDNYLENSFDELLTEFEFGTQPTYLQPHLNGYQRLLSVCSAAASLQIDHSHLRSELLQMDRTGICHHLANEGRITSWVC